jgi:hypothetical protein
MSIKEDVHRLVETLSEEELRTLRDALRAPTLPDFVDLPTLIDQQAVAPLTDPLALAEGVWPEDEEVDEFLAARAAWQHEGEDA